MQKEFTVNVPDQLWVNSWEDGLTKTYTYEGPQYFYIGLDHNLSLLELRYGDDEVEADDFTEEEKSSFQYVITVNSEDNPDLAQLLYPRTSDTAHTFEDEINHDGSIYQKITNPDLRDYFIVNYRINSSSPDQAECFADPIYKETSNVLKTTATSRLAQVKKYNDAYDFDDSDQAKIDSFILAINTYLETIETAYPWKYITMDITEIPKIPVSIQLLFNQLPEID
jgi:hypothetical protein